MIKNNVKLPTVGGTSKKNTKSPNQALYGENLSLFGGTSTPAILTPNNTVKMPNMSGYMANIMPVQGGGVSGGNKSGVTDEGVIVGNPNVTPLPSINNGGNSNGATKKTMEYQVGRDEPTFSTLPAKAGETSKVQTLEQKTSSGTTTSGGSIWDKLKNGNFANGVRDLISRLFGKTGSTENKTAETKATGTGNSGTTYAANIGTGANAEQKETANTNNAPPTTATTETTAPTKETASEKPMTYNEYMEMLKAEAETSRQAADKQAEIAKERATVDAHADYEQSKATYGANAETMAQMGLTGGGYSDYLNAQAYAQKRDDIQHANVVEAATKAQNQATYQEYVNSLNQKLADKALYEEQLAEQRAYAEKQLADERAYNEQQTADQRAWEEKQAEQTRKDGIYATLWEGVQDPDGTYTAEAIRALGKEYGLSEAQIGTLTNILTATQAKSEEEKSSALKDAAIADITSNGGNVSDGYLDGLKDIGLSDEDAQEVQDAINNSVTNTAVEEIDAAIKSGDINSLEYTLSKADKYYANGSITKEKYNELYGTYSEYCVKSIMDIDYGSDYSKKLTTYLSQKTELGEMLAAGKITQSTYNSLISKMDAKNKNSCSGGWYIQGLGSGRNKDDVDITIGSTSRNKDEEYDLLCGDAIGDETLIAELNRIATGNPNKSPSTSGEGSGWFFGAGSDPSISSNEKPNKLIVAYGDMYLYTTKGWVPIKNDNNDVNLKNAINKFLGGGN